MDDRDVAEASDLAAWGGPSALDALRAAVDWSPAVPRTWRTLEAQEPGCRGEAFRPPAPDGATTQRYAIAFDDPGAPCVQLTVVGRFGRPPTAVVTFNDQMAVGVLRGLTAAGLRVPADVSVAGFDDTVLAGLVLPNLTTVATPLRTIGHTAVTTVLSLLGGATAPPRPTAMPARLVVRESIGPRRERR